MSGNYIELSIDQNRNIKAECVNAVGELTNLLPAVLTGVSRIRLDPVDRSVDDFEALLAPFTPIRRLLINKIPKLMNMGARFWYPHRSFTVVLITPGYNMLGILGKSTVDIPGNWESAPGISQVQG
jgi:hypothetical protein